MEWNSSDRAWLFASAVFMVDPSRFRFPLLQKHVGRRGAFHELRCVAGTASCRLLTSATVVRDLGRERITADSSSGPRIRRGLAANHVRGYFFGLILR